MSSLLLYSFFFFFFSIIVSKMRWKEFFFLIINYITSTWTISIWLAILSLQLVHKLLHENKIWSASVVADLMQNGGKLISCQRLLMVIIQTCFHKFLFFTFQRPWWDACNRATNAHCPQLPRCLLHKLGTYDAYQVRAPLSYGCL